MHKIRSSKKGSLHPPSPILEKVLGTKGPWPLGAECVVSCSDQFWNKYDALCLESVSSHIIVVGYNTFEGYGSVGWHIGESFGGKWY